jgi:NAD(P)-dependent dehydrogenase (short-subunit alcohol dehydrogenase family)
VALVVGAGTGIGRAAALALADRNRMALAGRRREPLEAVAGEIRKRGQDALAVPTDVLDREARTELVAAVIRQWGRIDVLVVSTGAPVPTCASWLEWSEAAWREEVEVGALSAFALAQLVVPGMAQRGHGRLVLIGSVLGEIGVDPLLYRTDAEPAGVSAVPYHAGKGAILATARALAGVVGGDGVTVNVVSPGMIDTEAVSSLLAAEVRDRIEARTPVGRLGRPEEVGAAVAFLAADEAGFITGQQLVVDGGWSAW